MTPRLTPPARRRRRLLPTILVLAFGFVVVLSGLVGLWQVFHRERDQARQALARQRQALEHYARQALEQRFDRDLRTAGDEAAKASGDPLRAAGHLLWVEAGRQLLPRLALPVPGDATPASDLYLSLLDGKSHGDAATGLDLKLHREFLSALRRSDDSDVERTFRALLRRRARYLTAPEHDLPAMLAVLQAFRRDSTPAPGLLRALLHDGLDDGPGGELVSLSRLLLEHRNRFTAGDFSFLSERLIDLATDADVPYQAFLERSREHPAAVPIPPEEAASAPASGAERMELLEGGRWLVRRQPGGLLGVRVELGESLREIAGEMRSRGLLSAGDEIRPANATLANPLTFSDLSLTVDSIRWPRQAADIEARYRLKAGLVLLTAALAAAMAALTVALQARRLRLVELKSEFVATVSHELRTPLASVRLLAETVDRRAKAPELRDYPARIVREIDGLSFLVENILSFNRLERGRVEPRLAQVPLGELIDEVREDLKTQVEQRVVIEGLRVGIVLNADRALMKLLLLNLARNAALYNDRDPVTITVEHRAVDENHEILVRDNGRGIAEHERDKIFDEFYTSAGGPGLGLAICRRIAELHRGKISIADSSSEGTTFRLELPSGD